MVHKYLFKRNQNWYFRWRVPASLIPLVGQAEIRKSLRTINKTEASSRAAGLILVVSELKRDKNAFLGMELDEESYLVRTKNNMRRIKKMLNPNFEMKITKMKTPQGYEFTTMEVKGDMGGRVVNQPELPAPVESEVEEISDIVQEAELVKVTQEAEMLFSELYEEFLNHKVQKADLSESMQKEYNRYFTTLVEIMGDLPISTITRRKLKEALQTYQDLPVRNRGKYKGRPVDELLSMEIPEDELVADKTVDQVRKMLQGIFVYAIEEELLTVSPARDMKLNLSGARTYAKYEDHEVVKILESCFSEQQEWKRWIPWLAAYTGARRGELVQLRKQDVKFDQTSQRHYLLITDQAGSVKTENAIRQVPIHENLIQAGFLDFVENSGSSLFPDLNVETVTKWFSEKRKNLGIDYRDDYGKRKVLHSFRHTFVSKARAANNPDLHVQQVVGHEKTSAGVTDRYTHAIPLKDLLKVVDSISYNPL
ncbi:MAG: DUF3258 domain-containing protein [Porticoccaceae bacterium]